MAKKQKKPPPPEPEGETAPLWIVSFCDLALILMAFFAIMAATSPSNLEYDPEWNDVVAAVKKAFKYVPKADSDDPMDIHMLMGALKNRGRGKTGTSGKRGEAQSHVTGLVGKHDLVSTIRTGTQATIGGRIPFEKDSAKVSPEDLSIILAIADKIRGHTNVFVIKGHTSRDEQYRLRGKNKSLADKRARQVELRLIAAGVPPNALRIQDCRDYEPLKEEAYTEIDHQVNRRVEVIATEAFVNDFRGDDEQKQQHTNINQLDHASETNAEQ